MPRQCSVCASNDKERVDSAIAAGQSQSVIALRFGFSQSSLSRHASRHLGNAIGSFDLTRARAGIRDADLLSTLVGMLADSRAVAASAMAGGRASMTLQANGSSRELIKLIHEIQQSPDDPVEILEAVAEGTRLAEAAATAIRAQPAFGAALAAALDSTDPEMADQIRGLADRAQKSLDVKWSSKS